jgi:cytochrome c1
MRSFMPKRNKHKLVSLCLAALLAGLWLVPALAQEDVTAIKDPSFGDPMSVGVPFPHNAHNEKAGLKDCALCHHTFKNGQFVPGLASVGQKCSDCHKARPAATDQAPALMTAFHQRCQDCHKAKAKGPVTCSKCHKN